MTESPDPMRSGQLRWRSVGLVFLGGSLGVLAREGLMLGVPNAGVIPTAVLLANVAGALLLGLLLESMGPRGEPSSRRESLRLLLGTGVLGGFTTYSALAMAVLVLWSDGEVWIAAAYGLGTLLLGGIATWCGVWLGEAWVSQRQRRTGRSGHG